MRLIDADAFKEHLLMGAEFLDEDTILTVVNTLDCEPSIDPESLRPNGKWGNPIKVDAENIGYKCSEYGEFGVPCWHYCPNCGARMEG